MKLRFASCLLPLVFSLSIRTSASFSISAPIFVFVFLLIFLAVFSGTLYWWFNGLAIHNLQVANALFLRGEIFFLLLLPILCEVPVLLVL